MNLLSRITGWFSKPTPVTVVEEAEEVVVVDEAGESAGEIFTRLCRTAGVKNRELIKVSAAEVFEAWYVGPVSDAAILEAISTFKNEHPGISAKLSGKI
jgi:hypothetical protein